MQKPNITHHFRRFWFLWVPALLIALFVGLQPRPQTGISTTPTTGIQVLAILNQHWTALKQNIRRSLFSKNFTFSPEIQILSLRYPNRANFWFDDEARRKLRDKLTNYPGPVLLLLDPLQWQADPILSPLLKQPRLIKQVRVDSGVPFSGPLADEISLLEPKLSAGIPQLPPTAEAFEWRDIQPRDLNYYEPPLSFGISILPTSTTALSVMNYPLVQRAIRFDIPTSPFAAFLRTVNCQNILRPRPDTLQCEGSLTRYPIEFPITYYPLRKMPFLSSIDKIEASPKILIASVEDPGSGVWSISKEKIGPSGLLATVTSNLLQKHFPLRLPFARLIENISFLILLSILVGIALLKNLRTFLTAAIFIIAGPLLIDAAMYVFFNLQFQFIEETTALSLVGLVGFSTRAVLDFEERSLIERALQGYVSEQRLQRVLSGEETLVLSGRRAELSTLLLDIAGFSKLTQHISPEALFTFIQKFFSVVDPLIFQFGGTIDKKTGDGLLAFFGDDTISEPRASAIQAVRSALAIQDRLGALSASFWNLEDSVKCRIGVNTGLMMIGNAGSSQHFNYTVLGDAVNFTQRLEAACPVNEVLIGATTADYVRDHFKLEKTMIKIKHESEPATAFRVLAPES